MNEKGFSAVEAILIICILILIGVVGWLVYKDHHKTSAVPVSTTASTSKPAISTKTTTTPTTNPYIGWKTYCSTFTDACFKYNPSWTFAECAPQQINQKYFQDCSPDEGVKLILPDGTIIDWGVTPYVASSIDNCNANQTSYPGLTYSDITQVPGATNVYYVDMQDGYNVDGGYQVYLTLLNGDSGGQPAVGETGSVCPTNPIFTSKNGNYTINFNAGYFVNTNPGQTNTMPSATDISEIKQVLTSFYYQ